MIYLVLEVTVSTVQNDLFDSSAKGSGRQQNQVTTNTFYWPKCILGMTITKVQFRKIF